MNNQNVRVITYGQLCVFLFVTKIGCILLYPHYFDTEISVWILLLPLLINTAVYFLLIPLFIGVQRFEKTGIIQKFTADKWFSVFFLLYAVFLSIFLLYRLYLFTNEFAAKELNQYLIILVIFLSALYAAHKGIEAVVRFSAAVFVFIIAGAIIMAYFLFPSYDHEMLSSLSIPISENVPNIMLIVFSESIDLILLFYYSFFAKGRSVKSLIMWNCFQGILLIFMLILVSGTIGNYLTDMTFPFYHITDGAGPLQRLNPLFTGMLLSALICTLSSHLMIIKNSITVLIDDNKKIKIMFLVLSGTVFCILLILSNNPQLSDILFGKNVLFGIVILIAVAVPFIRFLYAKIKSGCVGIKKIARPISVLIVIGLSAAVLSGCGATQLNRRMIIQGVGIDKNGDNYSLTLITLDTEAENSENAVKIIRSSGSSTEQAFNNAKIITGKKIMLSQCLFIMMNKSASLNMGETLNYFNKKKDIMKTTNLMICDDTAEKLLETAISQFGYHSEDINVISDSNAIEQPTAHFSLYDDIVSQKDSYTDMLLPLVMCDKEKKILQTKGSVIVSKENNEIIALDNIETLSVLLINEKAAGYTGSSANKKINYRIDTAQSDIRTNLYKGKLNIEINLKIGISGTADKKTVKEELKKNLERVMYKIIHQYGKDVMNLSGKIDKKRIKSYSWTQYLKESKLSIAVC